ncbi:substrate-binding domain-containing protein [Verrucomicrobiaceae bacterium N1E253]|uniref:Substrate-binding domain-containing protein n=1 Tax=Oceaniferula marina TaxID=2748318 RepID=A0A851G9R2_9BACT|nr:substrate-binding domain-containing protein [Oceaniferula marina]NWK54156.1 substrate-binding domain-containing protein [Oceaniferula marina]
MSAFEKQRVSDQVAEVLCSKIGKGVWPDYLPSERWLSDEFGVSRDQIHFAILKLRERGVIALENRKNRVLSSNEVKKGLDKVVVVTPHGLLDANHGFLYCIDHLRNALGGKGVPLYVETSSMLGKSVPDKRLKEVVSRHQNAVWLLHRASPEVQHWFQDKGLQVVVLGTAAEGVHSPFLDVDHTAAVRHALGVMRRAGHTLERVLFLRPSNQLVGVRSMELGYRAEMASLGLAPCAVSYRDYDRGLEQKLSSLFSNASLIDGVVVTSYRAAIFTCGWLAVEKGLIVGRDLSLLCLSDGPALALLHPSVAYYSMRSDRFSTKLVKVVTNILKGRLGEAVQVQLMPDYVKGDSICHIR